MTLQELIGELQTLALAYPAETDIVVHFHEYEAEITGLKACSELGGLHIVLETQA